MNRKSSAKDVLSLSGEDLPHLKNVGRRERRAAETRLRLFRCALQLFSEHGFSNVTVEDITEAADVGKGTFFNYFESKDHVLGVLAEIQLGKVREAVEEAEAGKRSIESVLHHLFQRVAEEPGRSPKMARTLISGFVSSERSTEIMGENMAKGRAMITRAIEIGQKRKEIDPRLKKERIALQLQETFLGALLIWSLTGEPKLQDMIETSFQLFWRAIAIR
ncbi:MAG TPA: TetR/AcrR family transcriptional regulator [Terriglobales bacterium]|nr:TetR/AcrR family transcriptional regulator [Terriglobales bacterium]